MLIAPHAIVPHASRDLDLERATGIDTHEHEFEHEGRKAHEKSERALNVEFEGRRTDMQMLIARWG